MKKLILAAFAAAALVSCNSGSESTTEKKDTQTVVTTPAPDTAKVVTTTEVTKDTMHVEGKDTTKH